MKAELAASAGAAPGDSCSFVHRFGPTLPQIFLPVFFLIASVTNVNAQDAKAKCPPVARIEDVTETIHGSVVHDPYRWLEDQDSPETRAWIDAENACTQAVLSKLPGRDAIAKRLGELIKVDTVRLPTERGGRYFYAKRAANQDLFVLYMRRGTKGEEEVLVDPAKLSADHTTSVNFEGISDDGKLIGYGVRKGGEDEVSLHFLDTDTHQERKDVLPRARYISSPIFRKDKSGFYYSKLVEEGPRAYFHAMGTDPKQDTQDFRRRLHARQDFGGGFVRGPALFDVYGFLRVGVRPIGSLFPGFEDWRADHAGGEHARWMFSGRDRGRYLYLQTNWKAPKWRVMTVPLRTPSQEHWKEIIPEGQSRLEEISAGGRENRGAVFAERRVGTENISGGWDGGGEHRAAAVGNRGGNCGAMEDERSVFFRSNRSRSRRRFTGTIWRRGGWKCGQNRRCRWMRERSN